MEGRTVDTTDSLRGNIRFHGARRREFSARSYWYAKSTDVGFPLRLQGLSIHNKVLHGKNTLVLTLSCPTCVTEYGH